MSKATTTRKVDYFRLPRPLWRKLKKCLPKKRNKASRGGRPSASFRPGRYQRHLVCALDGLSVEGCSSGLVRS